MKNLFFAVVSAMTILCSCSKDSYNLIENSTHSVAHITFTSDEEQTRAFFGTTATAETWEKNLSSLSILVFNTSGNLVTQRSFSSSELSAKSATFALPGVGAGENCDFYAIANMNISDISTKSALLSRLETSANSYNGTFAEVSTGSKREGGFVMSGSTSKAIAAVGATTNVAITLKRTVAKVAVQITKGSSFNNLYSGSVKINSISISKAASQTTIVHPVTPNPSTMNYTFNQASNVSGSNFQNLFYIFENGNLAAGNRVKLTINATYDRDGNFSTTTDQNPLTYEVELDGNSSGSIIRNGYYRISATINGLSGSEVLMNVTVSDWETVRTQNINLGI